jgi:peptide subunit release factor 1 (eRF1)
MDSCIDLVVLACLEAAFQVGICLEVVSLETEAAVEYIVSVGQLLALLA